VPLKTEEKEAENSALLGIIIFKKSFLHYNNIKQIIFDQINGA